MVIGLAIAVVLFVVAGVTAAVSWRKLKKQEALVETLRQELLRRDPQALDASGLPSTANWSSARKRPGVRNAPLIPNSCTTIPSERNVGP